MRRGAAGRGLQLANLIEPIQERRADRRGNAEEDDVGVAVLAKRSPSTWLSGVFVSANHKYTVPPVGCSTNEPD